MSAGTAQSQPRILVAGVGNMFFGDDGFATEVIKRLRQRPLPKSVQVIDYGIRGIDLALALQRRYEAVIVVDALSCGCDPGTVRLLRIGKDDVFTAAPPPPSAAAHAFTLASALHLAAAFGAAIENIYLVGCEPGLIGDGVDRAGQLSAPVSAAVDQAISIIETMLCDTLNHAPCTNSPSP